MQIISKEQSEITEKLMALIANILEKTDLNAEEKREYSNKATMHIRDLQRAARRDIAKSVDVLLNQETG